MCLFCRGAHSARRPRQGLQAGGCTPPDWLPTTLGSVHTLPQGRWVVLSTSVGHTGQGPKVTTCQSLP